MNLPAPQSGPSEETSLVSESDSNRVRKAALVLRALNHKLRQRIIDAIHENKKLTVTELYVRMRLAQPVASQHLAILRKAGIVSTERDGKFIYYTINHTRINEIMEFVKNILG
jgi:DNA-binding transcriptional ArsR family regulator